MKVTIFILGLLSAVLMLGVNSIVIVISFFASLLGLAFQSSLSADQDVISGFYGAFGLSTMIEIIAIAVLILCIIGFVKGRRGSTKAYTIIYGITCGLLFIGNLAAFPLAIWCNDLGSGAESMYAWPAAGLALAVIMLILTIVNAIVHRNKAV